MFQEDGMMDHETDGDGAINLSTSQRPSAATTPNGALDYDDHEQVFFFLTTTNSYSNFPFYQYAFFISYEFCYYLLKKIRLYFYAFTCTNNMVYPGCMRMQRDRSKIVLKLR